MSGTDDRPGQGAPWSFRRKLGVWLVFSAVYGALLAAALAWWLPPEWKNLGWLLVYMSLANAVVPLAVHPPLVAAGAVYPPLLVAAVGAVGTCYANSSEFVLLGPVFAHHKAERIKQSGSYQWLLTRFRRAPRLCIYVASCLPLPVDFIRFTAIASGYPMRGYLPYDMLGRFTRYLLIALVGAAFQKSQRVLVGLMIALLVAPALPWVYARLRQRRARGDTAPPGREP